MTTTSDTLEGRIAQHFDELTPKQQILARLILDNRYITSVASAAEIGEKVQTSAATVVRLCQALGYQGLPDLQAAIRSEMPTYLTAVERLEKRFAFSPPDGQLLERAFHADVRNIERTADGISPEQYRQIVETLAGAREIIVIAGGVVTGAAVFLAHSLRVIGLPARAVLDGDVEQVVNTAHIRADDVVVGIGVWRYISSTVQALQWARKTGARIVVISDSIVSPLARQADMALEVATAGVAHSMSVTALMSLLNALIADIALRNPERSRQALLLVDRQFKERGLVIP